MSALLIIHKGIKNVKKSTRVFNHVNSPITPDECYTLQYLHESTSYQSLKYKTVKYQRTSAKIMILVVGCRSLDVLMFLREICWYLHSSLNLVILHRI